MPDTSVPRRHDINASPLSVSDLGREAAVTPRPYHAEMMLVTVAESLESLAAALRSAWSAETANGVWSSRVPSRGQCAVTALVIQDFLGGELLRTEVDDVSHYWNRLPDGSEVDLTRAQFEQFDPAEIQTRPRAYVLLFPDTCRRYQLLRNRVLSIL